eukprot:scaffold98376_cov85-Cyclotella_meneghiniana.AAC.1
MCGGGGGTSGKEFSGHGVCVDITVGLVVFFCGGGAGRANFSNSATLHWERNTRNHSNQQLSRPAMTTSRHNNQPNTLIAAINDYGGRGKRRTSRA